MGGARGLRRLGRGRGRRGTAPHRLGGRQTGSLLADDEVRRAGPPRAQLGRPVPGGSADGRRRDQGSAGVTTSRSATRRHAMTVLTLTPVVSASEWEAARAELLAKEKEATRARDALAAERRRLPRVRIDKDYVFAGPDGK